MREIKVTESSFRGKNVLYVYSALSDLAVQINAKVDIKNGKNRCEYKIIIDGDFYDIVIAEIFDKIADIIAVNYKYSFFKKNLKLPSLKSFEKEILLTALISADIEEDKRYVMKKLKLFSEYAVDGIFNFRMKPLKEKWQEIASYIPKTFTQKELKDFITYLIKDKSTKKVYIDGETVYDRRFKELKKRQLLIGDSGEYSLLKEILLSGAGSIELESKIKDKDEKYIKELYGDKVLFGENYFNR